MILKIFMQAFDTQRCLSTVGTLARSLEHSHRRKVFPLYDWLQYKLFSSFASVRSQMQTVASSAPEHDA